MLACLALAVFFVGYVLLFSEDSNLSFGFYYKNNMMYQNNMIVLATDDIDTFADDGNGIIKVLNTVLPTFAYVDDSGVVTDVLTKSKRVIERSDAGIADPALSRVYKGDNASDVQQIRKVFSSDIVLWTGDGGDDFQSVKDVDNLVMVITQYTPSGSAEGGGGGSIASGSGSTTTTKIYVDEFGNEFEIGSETTYDAVAYDTHTYYVTKDGIFVSENSTELERGNIANITIDFATATRFKVVYRYTNKENFKAEHTTMFTLKPQESSTVIEDVLKHFMGDLWEGATGSGAH